MGIGYVFCNLASIVCFAGATYLISKDKDEGWGWLIFAVVLCAQCPQSQMKDTKNKLYFDVEDVDIETLYFKKEDSE